MNIKIQPLISTSFINTDNSYQQDSSILENLRNENNSDIVQTLVREMLFDKKRT